MFTFKEEEEWSIYSPGSNGNGGITINLSQFEINSNWTLVTDLF